MMYPDENTTETTAAQAVPLPDLIRQKEALEAQIAAELKKQRAEAITKVRQLVALHGLTAGDCGFKGDGSDVAANPEPKTERKPVAPKYRNPETGETWTGRGLMPKWLTNKIAAGGNAQDYKILEPA